MKKENPTLTVITVCFNIKDEIERTCKSIVNQTWQDFEWIVVDGGSTDGTVDILKKYTDRINILISEPDKGIYNAMNKGIKLAHGKWLNFMNGGDKFAADNVLEKVFKNKAYDADVLYGWQYFAKSKTCRKYTDHITMHWLCSNALGHQALFIKKSCFNKYGLYLENLKICADFEKNVCLKKNNCKFHYLPFTIAWFAEDGISSSNKKSVFINDLNEIYKLHYTPEEVLEYGREYCKPYFLNPIVSLTSFPARINTVNQTIESLLKQTIKPDKIILWLGFDKFPNREADLPYQLLESTKKGLTIKWCKDLRSYTKLIPTLKEYPNNIIITVDDDILYPENWLERLLNGYLKHPNMINCHRAHRIRFNNNKLLPYKQWYGAINKTEPSFLNFLTGVGGVLYPPHCLYKNVLNVDKFQKLCPLADDIWFWAMAVLNKTKINVVENNIPTLQYVEGTQEADNCLWKTNNGPQNLNDIQLKNVLSEYPEILENLKEEMQEQNQKGIDIERKIISYKLFNFIPLYSLKKLNNVKIIKILGIPVLKIYKD